MNYDDSIIDPHVHFWDPRSTPRRVSAAVRLFGWNETLLRTLAPKLFPRAALEFVGRPDYVMNAYLPGDFLRDAKGFRLRGFVHVQAGWHGHGVFGSVGETRWLEALCGRELLGIVAQASLDDPHASAVLDAHRAESDRVVGVRDMTAYCADPSVLSWSEGPMRMATDAWRRGLALVGERGMTFDAWCYQSQLRLLSDAVKTAPNTRVVLCHLGTPIGVFGPYQSYGRSSSQRTVLQAQWFEDLARLAEARNVHLKLSGLCMPVLGHGFHSSSQPPTVDTLVSVLGPVLQYALDTFGVERCMFASNFPMDKVSVSWSTLYAAFSQIVSSRSKAEQRALFHDNAVRFYGLRVNSA